MPVRLIVKPAPLAMLMMRPPRSSNFRAGALQQATLNAGLGAFESVQSVVVQSDPLAVIGVQIHRFNSFDSRRYFGKISSRLADGWSNG